MGLGKNAGAWVVAGSIDLECKQGGPGNLLVILHTLRFENHWVTAMDQAYDVVLAKISSHPSQSLTL